MRAMMVRDASLHRLLMAFLAAAMLWSAFAASAKAETLDKTSRSAILSAFEPEWQTLRKAVENAHEHELGGTIYVTGEIAGKPVLLFYTGISMVNATMATQRALDHFAIERIIVSGIAGGVDPALNIGDVVVAEAWSQYLEAIFARKAGEAYQLPEFAEKTTENFGMIFPQPVRVQKGREAPERVAWFKADAQLLELARKLAGQDQLAQCSENACFKQEFGACEKKRACLKEKPRLIVGGNGVSGQAFVDNKAFREYVSATFKASVLDMETAAVAHVAYANNMPFIAFRSLSDLAGGGEGENEIGAFFQLASENSAALVLAFIKALP